MIKFETLVTAAFSSPEALWAAKAKDPVLYELARMAEDLDSLRERLEDNAMRMAMRFENFAKTLSENRLSIPDPPTGWSTLRDIERDAAVYDATLKVFERLYKTATTRDPQVVMNECVEAQVVEVSLDDGAPEPA